jgi:hypothetical protein
MRTDQAPQHLQLLSLPAAFSLRPSQARVAAGAPARSSRHTLHTMVRADADCRRRLQTDGRHFALLLMEQAGTPPSPFPPSRPAERLPQVVRRAGRAGWQGSLDPHLAPRAPGVAGPVRCVGSTQRLRTQLSQRRPAASCLLLLAGWHGAVCTARCSLLSGGMQARVYVRKPICADQLLHPRRIPPTTDCCRRVRLPRHPWQRGQGLWPPD